MPEITVIVPVYEVEEYLEKCIDSILSQTLTDFELILVDDGSPDSCGDICDEYAALDSRIIVIHQENGGLSQARNAALDITRGKYVTFIDSDDYIAPGMLEDLYFMIEKERADIVIPNHYCVDHERVTKYYDGEAYEILTSEKAVKLVFEGKKAAVIACGKLYSRNIFEGIRFPQGKTIEDAYVIVDTLHAAQKIIYTSKPYYYYVKRLNSISNKVFSCNDWNVLYAYHNNLEKIKVLYPRLIWYGWYRYIWAVVYILNRLITDRRIFDENVAALQKIIKKHVIKIPFLPVMTWKRKVLLFLLLISPKCYFQIETVRSKK